MPNRDNETIIVDRGTNPMAVVAGILFAIAVLVVLWLVFFNGSGGSGTVDVDVPEVSVDVAPDAQ
jgi:hypothetical protein